MNQPIKSISAVKPKRLGGHARAKMKRGGENIRWKRLTASIDEAMRELAKCPPDKIDAMVAIMAANTKLNQPITRLVYFKHLTPTQGMAGRRYADVMARYDRFHIDGAQRSTRSQSFEPVRGGEDQELERIAHNGNMVDYLTEARKAKRDYNKLQKVLARFADADTGRNSAKNVLDDLCLSHIEPPAQYRANIAAVLEQLAKEFGIKERR